MTHLFEQKQQISVIPMVICEICGIEIPIDDSFSFLVQMCTTGPEHIQVIQCDAPGAQHFGCTLDHAIQAAIVCLDEHHPQKHTRKVAEQQRKV